MIGRIYRLMDTRRVEMKQREIKLVNDAVLIKPEYMSICAADQRYYLGRRKREVMSQKLPMALIHEAIGTVLRDFSGQLSQGDKVVLIPLETNDDDGVIKGNYRPDSKFASSGEDGFMRDVIAIPRDRVITIEKDYSVAYVFSEVLSVALGAITVFEESRRIPADLFGVWGDGSMGYVMGLALRCRYPNAKIHIFGKNARKLQKFSFATATHYIDKVPLAMTINHAFECVGGTGSEAAINQATELISPQGTINLMGVSEETIPINTRRVLEKGLKLIGNSRSDFNDFQEAVKLIHENEACQRYLHMLISEIIEVRTENDISHAFEQDILNDFKTVIKWSI